MFILTIDMLICPVFFKTNGKERELYKMNLEAETNLRRWTPSAKDCLEIGCKCEQCPLYRKFFKYSIRKCQMKRIVIALVKKFGHPKDVKQKTILEEEKV